MTEGEKDIIRVGDLVRCDDGFVFLCDDDNFSVHSTNSFGLVLNFIEGHAIARVFIDGQFLHCLQQEFEES